MKKLVPISLRCSGIYIDAVVLSSWLHNIQYLELCYMTRRNTNLAVVRLPALQDLTIVGLVTAQLLTDRTPKLKTLRIPMTFVELDLPPIRSLEKLHLCANIKIPSMIEISRDFPRLQELELLYHNRMRIDLDTQHMSTEAIRVRRYEYISGGFWESGSCDQYEYFPYRGDP
jgi:hypothetical protein